VEISREPDDSLEQFPGIRSRSSSRVRTPVREVSRFRPTHISCRDRAMLVSLKPSTKCKRASPCWPLTQRPCNSLSGRARGIGNSHERSSWCAGVANPKSIRDCSWKTKRPGAGLKAPSRFCCESISFLWLTHAAHTLKSLI